MFTPETGAKLSPAEQAAHERSEATRQGIESEQALRELGRAFEKEVTPQQVEEAQRKAGETEETRPWGQ